MPMEDVVVMEPDSTVDDSKLGVVRIMFSDGGEILVTDKELIERLPFFARALDEQFPNWRKNNEFFDINGTIPYPKSAGEFVFEHVDHYISPLDRSGASYVNIHYPETEVKSMEELKDIIEVASYCNCTAFIDSMGFVIAQRLIHTRLGRIIDYLGLSGDNTPENELANNNRSSN